MHFVRKTKKTQSKTLCSLLAASIIFSSIMPTVVLANDEEETTAPVISETTITESKNDVTVDATTETKSTETTVDANVTSIPTDETEPETEVTKDIEEPPIEETTTETSAETVETSEISMTSETTKVTEETTTSETTVAETTTTEPTEVTEPEVPEEVTISENSIKKAQTIDEYFKLIAELPGDYRIIVDTEKDLSEIKVAAGVYYDGTYILCFSSDTEKASAINYLNSQGISYALDGELSICGHYTEVASGDLNPNAKIKVAVIDTGSNKANEKYSVLGDNGSDNNGHGTDMCNLILNETNNAYIISIKALNDDGTGQMSDVYAAVQMAEDLGVDYILMSMSIRDNGKYDAFKDLIKNTKATVFASAGNNGTNANKYLPASIDNVMTVGSIDDHRTIKDFSNYGTCVNFNVDNTNSTSEAAAIALGYHIEFGKDADDILSFTVYRNTSNGYYTYIDSTEKFVINSTAPTANTTDTWNSGTNYTYKSLIPSWHRDDVSSFYFYHYSDSTGHASRHIFCAEWDEGSPKSGRTYHKITPSFLNNTMPGTSLTRRQCLEAACAFGSSGDLFSYGKAWWENYDPEHDLVKNYDEDDGMYLITHIICDAFYDGEHYITSTATGDVYFREAMNGYIDYILGVRAGTRALDPSHPEITVSGWWLVTMEQGSSSSDHNSWYQDMVLGGAEKEYKPKFSAYKAVGATGKNLLVGQTYSFELWDQDASKQVATGVATVPANGASTIINWTIRSTGYSYADRYGDYLYLIGGHTYALMETTMSVNGAALATPSGWTKGTLHGKSCFYQTFSVSNGSSSSPTKSITITNYIDQVNIKLKKVSSTPVSGTYYKLNATYKLYASEDTNNASALGTFTCNAEGICNTTVAINKGTRYYFKETQAAQGHNIDTGIWAIIVNGDNGLEAQYKPAGGSWRVISNVASYDANSNTVTLTVNNTWKTPVVSVTKIADPSCNKLVAGNPCYSLAGTTFDVYYNSDVSKSFAQATKKDTITINTNGAANKNLQYGYGDYYFKETKAGKGYKLNPDLYCIRVSVDNNNTESYRSWTSSNNGSSWTEVTGTTKDFVKKNGTVYGLTITNKPVDDPINIQLSKIDSTGQKTTATVTGAVFRLEYYAQDIDINASVSGITPTAVYQITGIEAGRRKTIQFSDVAQRINGISLVSGDASYFANIYAQDNDAYYPLGTYRLYEYTAPIGYEKCNEVFRYKIFGSSSTNTGTDRTIVKENSGSYSFFAYTSTTDALGITNDDNPIIGYYTLTKAVNPTSLSKAGYNFEIYNGADLIATGTSQNDGRVLWTYKLAGLKSADNRTVLTGTTTYKLELAVYNTNGQKINYQVRELVKTITYKNTGIVFESICPTGWTDNTTYYSKNVTLTARTTTSENTTNDTITNRIESIGVTVVKNDITSEGAKTYNFRLYWYGNGASKDESKKTLVESFTITTNANGVGSAAFTGLPLGWYEIVEVDSAGNPISTNSTAAKSVAYTNATFNGISGTNNTVTVINRKAPTMSTQLVDNNTNTNVATLGSSVKFTDKVTYNGLTAGTYYVTGTIYDKSTNAPLTINGNTVTGQASFTVPSKKNSNGVEMQQNGTVNVVYTLDTTGLENKTLVCFEEIRTGSYTGTILMEHKNINDGNQTIYVPRIRTTLLDNNTSAHVAIDGTATLTDTISYSNLPTGKSYTVTGTLMYANGNSTGLTVTGTFTPTTASGTTTITYTVNRSQIDNAKLVSYVDLKFGNTIVASHKDLSDANQTIYLPKVTTQLRSSIGATSHIEAMVNHFDLDDRITYSNLLPNTEYTISGILMNAKTGEPFKDSNGQNITVTETFNSKSGSGTRTVTFDFDATITDATSLVAFEDIIYTNGNKDIVVARHNDLNDIEQSVFIPNLSTTLYDKDLASSPDTARNYSNITLVDEVKLVNLVVGQKYTLESTIMVKDTNSILTQGTTTFTKTTTFTATAKDQTVNIEFTGIDATKLGGKTLVCFETLSFGSYILVQHNDINDAKQTVHIPEIKTTLVSEGTNNHVVPATGTITLTDTVKYTNLIPNKEYTLSGKLVYADGSGDVAGATASRTFTPTSANGSTTMTFSIDVKALQGKTIVAFENLQIGNVKVATHADLTDKDQTVYVPEISTSLVDSKTNDHITERSTNVKLVDTVTYKNLVPNLTYTVTGTLYNKNTQEKVTKADGTPVTGSTTFKPTTANGTVEVEFTLDTTNYADETFVAFEVLTYGNTTVATHEEFDDVKQTVYVPDVHTTFYDKDLSTDKDTARSYENITLVDEVVYSNLIPNKEYTLVGTIMVKDTTPYALKDAEGNVITVTKTFKPTTPNGTETIEFTNIDGKLLEGKTTVAFETLIYNGIEIFVHANIDDEEQTVKFPKIRTQLKSVDTDDEVVPTDTEIELEDTVKYENLIVGKEYTIKGKLMFADGTGEVPNVTMTPATFTPTSANGTAVIKFKFNSNVLKNKTLVAFEDLYIGETKVASHADLTDKDQTVYIPEIHTTLLDTKTKEHVSAQGPITVVDTVSCNNLVIGKEYTLNGILMNKKTGEPLKDVDGNSITATITWKAEAKDGIKNLEFTFDSSLLVDDDIEKPDANGTGSLVAFEELTHNNITVTTHNDLTDFDQSVYVPSVYTELFDEKFVDATDPAAKSLTRNFSEVNIVDKVYFKNLTPGYTYSLRSGLYIRESSVANMAITDPNDPMYKMMVPFLDANGDQYKTTITFNPEDTAIVKDIKVDPVTGAISGMIEVKYTIDATLLSGKHIVAFETLDLEGASGSMTLVTHADPKNAYETVSIPEIGTKATDKVDGDQMLDGTQTTQTIVDTVSYTGLVPGIEYTVTGKLVVKKDYAEGEELEYVKDAEGKDLVVAVKFTPDDTNSTIDADTGSASGTVDVEFTFDASKYAGKYVVAFETLDYKGIEVAVHADINDEGQTVKIPLLIHVKIAKMDGKNIKYVLKNAKIAIYYVAFDDEGNPILDENNNEYQIVTDINGKDCIGVTDKDGFVEFTIMYDEHYKYYAKEIEAPRGYYLNNDYFEIIPTDDRESSGVCLIPIKIYDFIIPPKTGDNMNIGLYTTLALLSAIGICGGFYFIHKKKKSEDNA